MTITPIFLVMMELIAIGAGFLISYIIGVINTKMKSTKGKKN